jgi:uncharacterized protein (DUF433 family)
MGGKPCIRGMRVTVGTVWLGSSPQDVPATRSSRLSMPEVEDIADALSYAAWRAEEFEVPLHQP